MFQVDKIANGPKNFVSVSYFGSIPINMHPSQIMLLVLFLLLISLPDFYRVV